MGNIGGNKEKMSGGMEGRIRLSLEIEKRGSGQRLDRLSHVISTVPGPRRD